MREHNVIAAGCCWKLAMVASGCEYTLALAVVASGCEFTLALAIVLEHESVLTEARLGFRDWSWKGGAIQKKKKNDS